MRRNVVDESDFRILAHLLKTPLDSHAAIGRAVDLTGASVGARLRNLERVGVLRGWRAIVAAEAFGRIPTGYFFSRAKRSVDLTGVGAVREAMWATVYDDGSVSVLVYEKSRGDALPGLEALIGGAASLVTTPRLSRPLPRDRTLSKLDWRLVSVLLDRPRCSVKDLSSATGLSRRTVQVRRADLLRKGLVHVAPVLDEARAAGAILYHAFAFAEDASALAGVGGLLKQAAPFASFQDPPGAIFFGFSSDLATVNELRDALHREQGLHMGEALVPRFHAYCIDNVRALVSVELSKWMPPGPPSP